ncbi:MAG: hypothetical protein IT582_05130, partial [Opitutaceae bacterium]|nr:hypothetical protein [Opitutaceae bacterium]
MRPDIVGGSALPSEGISIGLPGLVIMDSAPQPHVSAADEIGAKVEAQMTRLLFQSAGFGLFSNFVLAALLVLGLADSIPWQSKGLWFAAMMTLSVVRLGLNLRYQRRELSVDQHRRWRMMFIIGTGLSGLLWGWAAWCFYREDQMSSSVLLVMILIGLNAGAARSLASVLSCSQVYVATTLLPLGAVCLSLSSPNWFLFGITVTYALFLLRTTSLLHDDLAKLHTLILQNESYVQELRAAKASAEDSNRIKGDFLATISHEIRTPMNGVIGMLQILRESSLTPEQLSQVNIATGSADTLLRLLNDVLDFSKVESGKLEFESIPFSPAESLREVSALLCSRATDKGLGFNLHLPSGDPLYVLGDSVRLKQVLLNLTGNAIKFTESGRVDLAMSISARDKKSATMHFSIRDTGIGIDRSTQAKLFQVFSQGDSSTTRR